MNPRVPQSAPIVGARLTGKALGVGGRPHNPAGEPAILCFGDSHFMET
jgi:hypothetical protein